MGSVVEMTGVVKRFGAVTALDGLDFEVAAGEVHGFLGPNGSGKSTTLRLLLGLWRSSAGTIRVLGLDPWREVATLHRRLAYVPGDVACWPNLTGGEVIDLLGRLQGGQDRARRDRLLELFGLDPTRKPRTHSKGNRQKVALVAALATDAELFLLDEPTSGLDPLIEDAFRGCVRELRAQGRTVVLSSHILREAEALSDRVSIIRAGKVVETGPLEQLRHLTRTSVTADVAAVPPRARSPARRPRPRRGEPPDQRAGRTCRADPPDAGADDGGAEVPHEPAADAGGPVPAPLRRRRWLLPVWILGFALITYSTALAGAELYPDMANRVEASTVLNATASMVALFGRIYDPTSIGALSLIK